VRIVFSRLAQIVYLIFLIANKKKFTDVFVKAFIKLESSQSPHTSAKAMLFPKWQHHLWFCSGFPYAPLKAMVTKISK